MARSSVVDGFIRITKDHEGIVPWPYLDSRGLVTIGMGNLAEVMTPDNRGTGHPTEAYFDQPWKNSSGGLASRAELQEAFDAVKSRQDLAGAGGGSPLFASLTDIRLGPPGTPVNVVTPEITALVAHTFDSFEQTMRQNVHTFDALPADAQLALMEHAWAVGPSLGGWPNLCAALNASTPDFRRAAFEDHQIGVTPKRAQMSRDLWQNAFDVQQAGADFDHLFYPGTVSDPSGGGGGGDLPFDPTSGLSASLVSRGGKLSTRTRLAIGGGLALAAIGTASYFGWKAL